MMRPLYLFNPENDLALAAGVPNYTAPRAARKLREDLQMLPAWVADGQAFVLAHPSAVHSEYLRELRSHLSSLDGVAVYHGNPEDVSFAIPWGWSLTVCEELRRLGLKTAATMSGLETLRQLSHRRTTVNVFEWLRRHRAEVDLPDSPVVCHSVEEVHAVVARFGIAVMKVPWSSSGRGVCRVKIADFELYREWVAGILRRQGALLCERYYDKIQDFAMEFRVERRKVEYEGLSVFSNTPQMSYDHAIVAPESVLRQHLSAYLSEDAFEAVKQAVKTCLQAILPEYYRGYVGVDMIIYRDAGGMMRVNPCIEVNLRMTMGVVASKLSNRVLAHEATGKMYVLYHRTTDEAKNYCASLAQPEFSNGRLCGGSLLLSPVPDDVRYTAVLTVD